MDQSYPHTEEGDERYATQRARYLSRATELRRPQAEAVAWAERGYSFRAAARRMDSTESTVQAYMERAMARYGLEIAETLLPDEGLPDYEVVEPGYHRGLPAREMQVTWLTYVDRHQEHLPQEWVNDVLEAALGDGIDLSDIKE